MIVSAHDGYPRHLYSGADYIEVDIRRTPAGVIVLAHDELEPGRLYPTYEELLQALPTGVGLHLDLKQSGFERQLMERAPDKVVVTPDFRESAETIKRHFPHVRVSPIDFVTLDQRHANDQTLNGPLPVWVWTVDDKRLMKRLVQDPRVEAIITNRPELALNLRSGRA
ncbi:MAG TPA: glycerophosphodiester phosphodiesterase [Candidatus Dormibacteraeota bacterium]|nr:glycerophosphodiester phosphodiesterase [Candidatus Dormibacteraeota bacterium]